MKIELSEEAALVVCAIALAIIAIVPILALNRKQEPPKRQPIEQANTVKRGAVVWMYRIY